MKKQLLLFAFTAVTSFAFAQTAPSFGVRAGITSSTMKGDAVDNLKSMLDFTDGMVSTNSRTGFYGGASVNVPLGAQFSVEPGLYYAQKGYEMQGDFAIKGLDFLGANAKAKLNTQYIDLPLLLKADMGGLQIFAGPQISYLVNADLKTTAGALGINLFSRSMDATDNFNRWDAAVTGGVGYQFSNGVNIRASYDHGLSKVDEGQNVESYNRAFKVGIGLNF